jgi:Ulp1 family protease
VDKLKANLLGEMASAEWELLEENEWDDGPTEPDQSPFIQNSNISSSPSAPIQSNEGANNEPSNQGADDSRRSKGNSGWMKLNNR